MTEAVAGEPAASPTPTPMRANSKCVKLVASPEIAVANDHRAVLMEMMSMRLRRSASRAIGILSSA
jgi:hypothetical protein